MARSDGQEKALAQLHRIESIEGSPLKVLKVRNILDTSDWLQVNIAVDCRQFERKDGGLVLNDSESFKLYIHRDFPWIVPDLYTAHARFRGFPHVQWRRHLCVYLSVETQWDPSRGMFGFMAQADRWLRKAAINELDDPAGPLHPPVAYPSANCTIYTNTNVPEATLLPWFGATLLESIKPDYYGTVAFAELHDLNAGQQFSPALLLDFELSFEYPRTLSDLLSQLESCGVKTTQFFAHLMIASERVDEEEPMRVCIGTPSRGIAGDVKQRSQHLQFWEIGAVDVKKLRLSSKACDIDARYRGQENYGEIRELVNSILDDLWKWSRESTVEWCNVIENRPEILIRRDAGTPMDWFKGKAIALWGCGALGSLVAEHLVRAGVSRLLLYDNKCVGPGILVRQNYTREDLGCAKSTALKRRLLQIAPEIEIVDNKENLYLSTLNDNRWDKEVDLVIDATASLRVRSKLESVVAKSPSKIPIAAMMISARARHGICSYVPPSQTSATYDVYRCLGQKARSESLSSWVDAFWEAESKEHARQPEPGCSDPTFVASHADVARLASQMLNSIAKCAAENSINSVGGLFAQDDQPGAGRTFHFRPYITINARNWQFRIAQNAWRDMQGWIEAGARVRSPEDETGGLLFGEIDDLLAIAWINSVSGPPSDSTFDSQEFVCGTVGVPEHCAGIKERSGGKQQYVGTWHSHPVSAPQPSETDFRAIGTLFTSAPSGEPFQLMVIAGHTSTSTPEIGAYIFEQNLLSEQKHVAIEASCQGACIPMPQSAAFGKQIGLALSGGGSRAVAFHLGTLRALNDLGLLDDVQVISGVSGGSVMTGLLGYTNEPFAEIDRKTVDFLKNGLVRPALKKLLHPRRSGLLLRSLLTGTLPRLFVEVFSAALSKLSQSFPGGAGAARMFNQVKWPVRRSYSRTHVMADAIAAVVGNQYCTAPTRGERDIVFNACELRTGTAFRMSNKCYGSWRYGYSESSSLRVADAIAASAAYPAALPAFDWTCTFTKNGSTKSHRVLVTDGGVFENMGVSVMEPGRDSDYTSISYSPEIIVASDAGMGQFDGDATPSNWAPRMVQVVNSVMRKVQDATKQRLHMHAKNGDIDSFLYIGLGQQDQLIPFKPGNWVERERVVNYPTDFYAMSEPDISAISNRAEALTRALATQYLLGD